MQFYHYMTVGFDVKCVVYFCDLMMAALFKIGKGELPPVPESLSKNARDFIL